MSLFPHRLQNIYSVYQRCKGLSITKFFDGIKNHPRNNKGKENVY